MSTTRPFAQVGGLEIVQHNPEEWAKVRAKFNISDNILDGFRFETLHPSGGKGGDLLKFHGSYYIVKQVTGSDQETLLKYTASLVDHITQTDSLIARFFLHFEVPADQDPDYGGKSYCVMNNWLPQFVNKDVLQPDGSRKDEKIVTYNQIYDLKGSADDKTLVRRDRPIKEVHKRFYNVNMWSQCCWSPERHDYYEGKHHAYNVLFHVTAEQQDEIQVCTLAPPATVSCILSSTPSIMYTRTTTKLPCPADPCADPHTGGMCSGESTATSPGWVSTV